MRWEQISIPHTNGQTTFMNKHKGQPTSNNKDPSSARFSGKKSCCDGIHLSKRQSFLPFQFILILGYLLHSKAMEKTEITEKKKPKKNKSAISGLHKREH